MVRLAVVGWLLQILVVYIAIVSGAHLADVMLSSAGLGTHTGSILVAAMCAVTTLWSMPRYVDHFVWWRTAFWIGRVAAAAALTIEVLVVPIVSYWVGTVVVLGVQFLSFWWASAAIGKWALRSYEHAYQHPRKECGGGDGDDRPDGQLDHA